MCTESKEEYWNQMVPELLVENIEASKEFYLLMGFSIKFERKEDKFIYLELNKVQIMLLDVTGNSSVTSDLVKPFGRGINFQIEINHVDRLLGKIKNNNLSLFKDVTESWYRVGKIEEGQREFMIQDPDGYLLRFNEPVGSR
jgi:hypothetical protein